MGYAEIPLYRIQGSIEEAHEPPAHLPHGERERWAVSLFSINDAGGFMFLP
jgi:hypothetical protein